jgi:DNA-binding XRE family transcriptional regulator
MAKEFQSPLVPLMAIRGKTQQDVADFLGVRRETVWSWTTGKTEAKLTLSQWFALAEFLGTTIDRMPRSFAPQSVDAHVTE